MTPAGRGIFFSCGEVSGDGYAAAVLDALRRRGFAGSLFGMGGPLAAGAGAEIVSDSRALHLMGVTDVLSAIPRLLRLKKNLVDLILSRRPGAVLLIDSPDFHLPLAASLRGSGWRGPIVYAAPPTVWAWRPWRVKNLRRDMDLCLPLFQFEHEYLLRAGVNSAWKGHPLVDEFSAPLPEEADPKRIALLPGSRRSEVFRLLPPLVECASLLKDRGYRPVFSIAPGMPEDLRNRLRNVLMGHETWEGPGRDLLASSAAAAGASGTVAVEAMMLGRFMAVLYRGGFLSWLAWKTLVKTPRISIPNLLAGEELYPELIQGRATGRNAFSALLGFLEDERAAEHIRVGLLSARRAMGLPGAVDFWAERLEALLSGQTAFPEKGAEA
ncbi:lipid-A-disaccharide synthase [Aminivibrio sp.]|uniref:lipid-A-disaccharide synthase n=1 Tax=Aminivibrio sp. TaxID=1872489 RepID=UPI00345E571C